MSEENWPQEKDWWEQEDEGYNTHIYLKAEYDWEDETKRIIKERLGLVDKDTEDDSRSEGEEKENYEYRYYRTINLYIVSCIYFDYFKI